MSIDNYRATLKVMTADLESLKPDDADLFASCAFARASELRGALWRPHARKEGLALAADFEALAQMAMALPR